MAAFTGFADETFTFLADLAAHNSKAWFDANRNRYEAAWKAPALDLIAALAPRMAALEPPLQAVPKLNGSLRRINRDVRFSRDKSPYNPMLHMVFWTGDHPNRSPGVHFVLDAEGLGYGAGWYGIAPPELARLRDRIMAPDDRAALLAALELAEKTGCQLDPPELKKLPKGYAADGDWEHLLRRKAFVTRTARATGRPDWLRGPEAVDHLMDLTAAMLPFVTWLKG